MEFLSAIATVRQEQWWAAFAISVNVGVRRRSRQDARCLCKMRVRLDVWTNLLGNYKRGHGGSRREAAAVIHSDHEPTRGVEECEDSTDFTHDTAAPVTSQNFPPTAGGIRQHPLGLSTHYILSAATS